MALYGNYALSLPANTMRKRSDTTATYLMKLLSAEERARTSTRCPHMTLNHY